MTRRRGRQLGYVGTLLAAVLEHHGWTPRAASIAAGAIMDRYALTTANHESARRLVADLYRLVDAAEASP